MIAVRKSKEFKNNLNRESDSPENQTDKVRFEKMSLSGQVRRVCSFSVYQFVSSSVCQSG